MLGKVQVSRTRTQSISRREYEVLLDAVRLIKYEARLSAEPIIMSANVQIQPSELYDRSFDSRFITKNELICRREYEARMNGSKDTAAINYERSSIAEKYRALKATVSTENLVMIGPNGTIVAKKEFEGIQWLNAAVATRMLLTLIFDQQTLATHTLSRLSNAFSCPDRLSKPSLDFAKVSDIIYCVQKRFGCTETKIGLLIVTTCSDVARSLKGKDIK
ncbi:early boundary activity protein 2-like [Bactrocera tryoni]|uniref:early boundary activity protein 2-like n=1 Tax=Bactrocera tryoni TaxID=59916 RepID=UPI001A9633A9|nr:early boundary activity protein 2-like [Bactrocera tryoni]